MIHQKIIWTFSVLILSFACSDIAFAWSNPCEKMGLTPKKFEQCSTPYMSGDVVARSLNIPGMSWSGHVGIYDTNYPTVAQNRVLEVLNQGSVIYKNSLDSFKKASNYWGVRYYGTGRPEYWGNYYPQVVNAGWEQRNHQPSYSFTAFYTEGKKYRQMFGTVRQKNLT